MPYRGGEFVYEDDFNYAKPFAQGRAAALYGRGDADEAARVIGPHDQQAAGFYQQQGDRAGTIRAVDLYHRGNFQDAGAEFARRGNIQGVQLSATARSNQQFGREIAAAERFSTINRAVAGMDPAMRKRKWGAMLEQAEREATDPDGLAFMQRLRREMPEWSPQNAERLEEMLATTARYYAIAGSQGENAAKAFLADMRAKAEEAAKQAMLEVAQRNAASGEIRAEAAQTTAEAAVRRADSGGGGAAEQRTFLRGSTLRDDYNNQPVVKGFQEIKNAYSRSQAYIRRIGANGAGSAPVADIGLVFAMAKINDPTSVVREQEFAQIASAGGFGARIRNLYNDAAGNGFSPATRAALWREIQSAYNAYSRNYRATQSRYADLARRTGVDPADVVVGYDGSQEAMDVPEQRDQMQDGGRYRMNDGTVATYDARTNQFYPDGAAPPGPNQPGPTPGAAPPRRRIDTYGRDLP